ncbi:MAG: hypothetical protein U9R38_03790 [Candidatus Margulisiibacteriota bacterium]|nr:hypothetical protein [Candidatus Margulisiibacteriota bacterium]
MNNYYDPMQKRIDELRPKYKNNAVAAAVLDAAQKETDGFKKNSDYFGYEFFIAQKT